MVSRKRGRSKLAAEAVESHSDLLSQILLRLPAKSLLKFKRVSRQWFDLISSTQFCMEHTRRNPNPSPTGIFFTMCLTIGGSIRYVKLHKDYLVKSSSRDYCKFPKDLVVMDSCNGLLLCALRRAKQQAKRRPYSGDWDTNCNLYVCNPATKQIATIPHAFGGTEESFEKFILCFDHSTPEKYSVICLRRSIRNKHYHVIDVYESETGSWRHSATFSEDVYITALNGVFWNGAVHWVDHNGCALYCFHLNQECFRKSIFLPYTNEQFDIKACQGHLYVSNVDGIKYPFMLTVYEMEHDFSCLSLKYSIRHDSLDGTEYCHYSLQVLGIFLGEEGQAFIVIKVGREVYTYNANVSNSVLSQTTLSGKFAYDYDHIYTESLATV